MRIALYQTFIEKGAIYSQGHRFLILWRIKEWETYNSISKIILEAIDFKGKQLDIKDMDVLSSHWEESEFKEWPFKIGKE